MPRRTPRNGIIPAYAGSTLQPVPGGFLGEDHPRIRGEHVETWDGASERAGSSPHTRGALDDLKTVVKQKRIIPAYAGSTHERARRSPRRWDHPRIRGEHEPTPAPKGDMMGSSPHTRGAPSGSQAAPPSQGIIPAYAGSTGTSSARIRSLADHPRIRGEHEVRAYLRQHVRRIIPAYAGSTFIVFHAHSIARDHPRIRGEHLGGALHVTGARGSSPHTRGALCTSTRRSAGSRIIPAYAGSTRGVPVTGWLIGDHPRIRGEHEFDQRVRVVEAGSSPHTRGAL